MDEKEVVSFRSHPKVSLPVTIIAVLVATTAASPQSGHRLPADLSTIAGDSEKLARLEIVLRVDAGLKGGYEFTIRGNGAVILLVWPPNSNRKLIPVCSGSVGKDVVVEALGWFAATNFQRLPDHSGLVLLNAFDVTIHSVAVRLGDEEVRKVFGSGPDAPQRPVSRELQQIEKKLIDVKNRLISEKKLKCAMAGS